MLGVELAKSLGQPMMIEYKPGAGNVLGTDAIAKPKNGEKSSGRQG
jgi:tripartite-type tricarboxylate transporter receptor subunit TctC